jgi:3-oxoacyl-[acyl-carrier-protein] synthase II
MTGHLLGAAGAVESLAVVMALYERRIPPTINLDDPDDEVTLDIVTGEPRTIRDGSVVALNNSFGFGGHNVALAFRSL